ncbi:Fungal Zn2-Cys6 binuclear cluster domain-containing protein [Cladophialophora immunda]|nr:Fungal Zn2-Cys6 binuclear cluster domain-containing protein [Cladophialophora immunda]
MTFTTSHDFPSFDAFAALESGWQVLPSASGNQFAIDLPQLSSEIEDNDLGSVDSSTVDAFWDPSIFMVTPADQAPSDNDPYHWRPISTTFQHHLPADLVGDRDSSQLPTLGINTDTTSYRNSSGDEVDLVSPTPSDWGKHAPTQEPPTPKITKQAPRRQNHSCDQCRSSKRACDLSKDISVQGQKPSKACSLCRIRGMKCTATWLANKQSEQRGKKRPRLTPPPLREETPSNLIPYTEDEHSWLKDFVSPPTPESNLARQMMAQETCSQHFNLYVDIFDIPISHCMTHESMPPGYSLGVAALSPMSDSSGLSNYLTQANSWIKSCWDRSLELWGSKVAAPQIFHTVSVLDALFQRNRSHPYRISMTSRDAAITETYKWAAIALAAQFATASVVQKDSSKSDFSGNLQYSHDVASAAWEAAKQKVFGNIAATTSFRVALSLLLFGLIPRPGSTDHYEELEEDAEYALCEGIRRLQTLCAQARARLSIDTQVSPTQSVADARRAPASIFNFPHFSQKDRKYILELIGAVEWMANLINAVTIGASRGRTGAIGPEMSHLGTLRSREHTTASKPGDDTLWLLPLHGHSMWPSGLKATEPEVVAFTTLWHNGASDETILRELRQSAYTAVVMWRSVAGLTMAIERIPATKPNYDDIFHHYRTTLSLISVWRSTFGILDSSIRGLLEQAPCELWRTVAFTSNDTDLAILVFCDLAQRLEIQLTQEQEQFTPEMERLHSALRSTSALRKWQRLISAEQVSMIASTCKNTSRPGFQGGSGLKSQIQDIAAHPNPFMMVQLHTLAAKALTGEVHSSISQLEGKRVSELTSNITICRQALEEFRKTLVTFPDAASFED